MDAVDSALPHELAAKRQRGTIGFGAMNDCYMPVEAQRQLTRRALEVIAARRFPPAGRL